MAENIGATLSSVALVERNGRLAFSFISASPPHHVRSMPPGQPDGFQSDVELRSTLNHSAWSDPPSHSS